MLTSLAFILLPGMLLGAAVERLRLPPLLGMLLVGIALGPHALNLIGDELLAVSAGLRQLALIIILIRAGLSLDVRELRRVGRPALLLCFVPACFEIAGMLLLAPGLLGISLLEAGILGSVIAAVSPAVVVPRMIKLQEQGYGVAQGIPQMIMAGASVDDVFVIVLFTALTSLAQGGEISWLHFAGIPVSILLGVLLGMAVGAGFSRLCQKVRIRNTYKVLAMLGLACLLVAAEEAAPPFAPVSGLLAVMAMGLAIRRKAPALAGSVSGKFEKLWLSAEICLFVLVGATVDLRYIGAAGGKAILLLLAALLFRMRGVFCCLLKTKLNLKERLFCMVAYISKATVQAAIGGLPLGMGLACGPVVLAAAVLSILITAPAGALGVDLLYAKTLRRLQPEKEPSRGFALRKTPICDTIRNSNIQEKRH